VFYFVFVGGHQIVVFFLSFNFLRRYLVYHYMLFWTLKASQAELRVLKIVLAIILCSTVVDALS